jgi:hypothetical protein
MPAVVLEATVREGLLPGGTAFALAERDPGAVAYPRER